MGRVTVCQDGLERLALKHVHWDFGGRTALTPVIAKMEGIVNQLMELVPVLLDGLEKCVLKSAPWDHTEKIV